MAAPAYKVYDRRSSHGYSNNSLIQAATQNHDRQSVPNQDYDFHRTISNVGRRTLLTLGRWMFWNIPALQGSILEQANLAVSSFIPQYYGRNKEWGTKAEEWLYEWHRIMDVAGWPYDYDTYVTNQVVAPIVEGDIFTLLTQNPDGYPMIQVIPSHRIGGRGATVGTVTGGQYDGARIIDGAIVNDVGRVLAFRVFSDGGSNEEFTEISARDMFPTYIPMFAGQVRGPSLLASSAFNWQDIAERRRFEMLAQKTFSSKTIIEENESGGPMPGSVVATAATFNDDGTVATPEYQKLDGGAYHYFKANTGSKMEALDWARPSANAQAFDDAMVRDAFRGTEWDSFFSLDPKAVGGAPMRIIVEKINRVIRKRRRMVEKACRRVDGYAISKAIKLGILNFDVDWYKWEYQGPDDITADRKYDSDVDLQEVAQGFGTRKRACAKRGDYWEEVDAQREAEADSDLTRAGRLAKKHGITIQEAMIILRPPTLSANFQAPQQQQEADTKPKGDE